MIEIPTRHAGETEVDYLRRKEEAFGLWQADALEHIRALEAENELLRQDKAIWYINKVKEYAQSHPNPTA